MDKEVKMNKILESLNIDRLGADYVHEVPVIPGISGLNLNILHSVDLHIIEDSKTSIEESINREHFAVHNIQKLVLATLKSRLLQQRQEARTEIEEIIQNTPGHLNALAELERLYKESCRLVKAESCRQKIEYILKSDRPDDIQQQAICLLEQAFVPMMEPSLINESNTLTRLTEVTRTLIAEHKQSEEARLNLLEQSLYHNKQTLRHYEDAISCKTKDQDAFKHLTVLRRFCKAVAILSERELDPPWTFHFAKAFNRYYDVLEKNHREKMFCEFDENETIDNQSENYIEILNEICNEKTIYSAYKEEHIEGISENDNLIYKDMKQTTIVSLRLFWKVIKDSKEDSAMSAYVARAYGFIGHIFVKRGAMIENELQQCELMYAQELNTYIDDPFKALDKACLLLPGDKTILNRYGRALFNKYFQSSPVNKLMFLLRAEDKLSESLHCGERNWFAYVTRMSVRKCMAKEICCKKAKRNLLLLAKEDGIVCFRTKATSTDMTILGKICRNLGKNFSNSEEEKREQLVEALDYLYHGSRVGSSTDIDLTTETAHCLFDLEEYEMAVEWQKRAWYLRNQKYSSVFHYLIYYTLTFIKHINDTCNTKVKFVAEKLLYILVTGKLKYEDISRSYVKLSKQNLDLLVIFFKVMIEYDIRISLQEQILLLEFLQFLNKNVSNYHYRCEFDRVEKILKEVDIKEETDYELSEKFLKPSIFTPLGRNRRPFNNEFKYDFFISYSHADERWVNHVLVSQLETSFGGDDIPFKGCIGNRDFQVGVRITDNIQMAIQNSFKVILVVTKHFLESDWCDYEADHAIMRSLSSKGDKNCIIPVCLDICPTKLPDKLKHLTSVDLTSDKESLTEINRIKDVLLHKS